MAERMKVKLDLSKARGEWVACAAFSGDVALEVKGKGETAPAALRELAEAIELAFEQLPERGEVGA